MVNTRVIRSAKLDAVARRMGRYDEGVKSAEDYKRKSTDDGVDAEATIRETTADPDMRPRAGSVTRR